MAGNRAVTFMGPRIRKPVAVKMAFVRAGAAPTVPISPGASLLLIRCTSTVGA
jgi:hypothetical protein